MAQTEHSDGRHLDLALLGGLSAMGEQSRETYRICTLSYLEIAKWEGIKNGAREGRRIEQEHGTDRPTPGA